MKTIFKCVLATAFWMLAVVRVDAEEIPAVRESGVEPFSYDSVIGVLRALVDSMDRAKSATDGVTADSFQTAVASSVTPGEANDTVVEKKKRKIQFQETLGVSFESGNVNKLDLKNSGWLECGDSIVDFDFSYKFDYSTADKKEKSKSFKTTGKLDFLQYGRWSPFVAVEFMTNKHKGYNYKVSALAGAKCRIYTVPKLCDYSISMAVVYDRVDYVPDETILDNQDVRLSIRPKIKQRLGQSCQLMFYLFYQPSLRDFSNYLLDAALELECNVKKNFYIGIMLEDEYTSKVPTLEFERNDFTMDLSFRFKYKF